MVLRALVAQVATPVKTRINDLFSSTTFVCVRVCGFVCGRIPSSRFHSHPDHVGDFVRVGVVGVIATTGMC